MTGQKLMTEISSDVLKQLQDVQIEILQEIVRICDKYQLHYFLIYGTLIGAIRHQGFIPWDDDLDIGMPRDDYDMFMKIAPKELSAQYYLQNSDTEKDYWLTFAKVRKNDTLFEEPSLVNMPDNIHKGIFVDIFPFDYVGKDNGWFVHLQFILAKAISETMYYKAGVYTSKTSLNYAPLDMILRHLSFQRLAKIYNFVVKSNGKRKKYLADFNHEQYYLKSIYSISSIFPEKEALFSGKKYKVPSEYDLYLKSIYGDYMQLPKEEDRVNHRTLRIIFNTKETVGKKQC